MQIIVFDLETTFTYEKDTVPEIVEIGAVKIEPGGNGIAVDTFQRYTFPEIEKRISARTRKFIGLNKEAMPDFIRFGDAFHAFLEWMDADKEYYLCTWGGDDKRIMIEHCARLGLPLHWLRNYNDIQPAVSTMLKGRKQIRLKDAIDAAGIVQEGRLHSALVDAIHTAHLLIKFNKELALSKNTPEDNYVMASPLYITCKACSTTKYYSAFGRKSKRCHACLQKMMKKEETPDTPAMPT